MDESTLKKPFFINEKKNNKKKTQLLPQMQYSYLKHSTICSENQNTKLTSMTGLGAIGMLHLNLL